ncbi:MAG: 4-(cytidine 5'-diphospho)-2-C-methyl-D-erythritol kinase [Clostridia bacterium]|nr:4-(cytidine 5'-diphospho)-2-C-methyl-D-erythritol kinase [Clostridia bacterium]
MNAIKEKAYAKINLYLDVVSKREDGFHDIKTVMHSLSLSDDVVVSVASARKLFIRILIDGNRFLPTDDKNIAYKAAALFFDRLGVAADVTVRLKKRIPVSAGLAGGSSDAAAVLRALNKLYHRPFTNKALLQMGAELGSDVPYCIKGKTALCEGRGEKITPIKTDVSLNAVIAGADERVSTPEAYKSLDAAYNDFKDDASPEGEKRYKKLVEDLTSNNITKEGVYNVFESVIFEKCPKAKALKDELLSLGASLAMMSGSGPSVFALFDTMEEALSAKTELISKGYKAWVAHSV